jgi:hypothetical protein
MLRQQKIRTDCQTGKALADGATPRTSGTGNFPTALNGPCFVGSRDMDSLVHFREY